MSDTSLAKIESEVRGFVRSSYPDMVVRAEYWVSDPARIALFFTDEKFRGLYRRQRYHYLVHLIPKDYYESFLADTTWFELAPGERPEDFEAEPDEEIIDSIAPDVLRTLQKKDFFTKLDDLFCPAKDTIPQLCSGDFRHAKKILQRCGFEPSDWSDVFHVLMGQGAYCDCEIVYNAAPESRLKSQYWQGRGHKSHR